MLNDDPANAPVLTGDIDVLSPHSEHLEPILAAILFNSTSPRVSKSPVNQVDAKDTDETYDDRAIPRDCVSS